MKKLLCFLLLAFQSIAGFTLERAQTYANAMPEFPEVVGPSFLLNPDYSRWHSINEQSLFSKMLAFTGLYTPSWSIYDFTGLLKELSEQRIKQRLDKPHSLFLQPKKDTQIIIIGPLYGAYHSLVRILKELERKKLLSNDLHLIGSDTYLVFVGDVCNGSPYNMETLTLVMALMKANPEQVIYLAGEQESNDTWLGYSLKKELTERTYSPEHAHQVSQLFSTLPLALFLKNDAEHEEAIRIGSRTGCVPPQMLKGKPVICPALKGVVKSVKTIIIGEKRLMSYRRHGGLSLAPAQEDTFTWAVFSAPNTLYKEHYFFQNDAFTIVTIGPTFSSSVISLYNQNINEQVGFTHAARYAVMSGKRLELPPLKAGSDNPLIPSEELQRKLSKCLRQSDSVYGEQEAQIKEKKPIYIGCTLDLTKGVSPLGKRARDGIMLCINQVNAQGGIDGRTVNVIFMDDEYSPEKARINVEQFMKTYKSSLFLGNLGSPTLQAYLELLKEKKLFLFFPTTGAPLFRTPDIKGVIHWRASYKAEAQVLTRYMMDIFKVRSFSFLYQNDAYGIGALKGAQEILKKEGITDSINVRYERNITLFTEQIKQIQDAATTGLGFFSTSLAAIEFIRQAGVNSLIGKKLFALSDLAEPSFVKFAQQRGLDFVIAQFAPNPQTSTMELVKEFREALEQHADVRADVFTLEGYMSARLTLYILEKAAPDFSVDSINKVIATLKNIDYKGLPLSFDPKTRELGHLLWLDVGTPEWIRQRVKE